MDGAMLYSPFEIEKVLMNSSEKPKSKRLQIVKSAPASAAPDTERSSIVEPESVCQLCFGTGMEVVPGEGARRCRCESPDHGPRLFQSARIPARYQHCTLANYDCGDFEEKSSEKWEKYGGAETSYQPVSSDAGVTKWNAKGEASRIIEDYLVIDGRGLLLVGPVGVGKTHLAVAILQELIERYQVRGLFYQFGALLRRIQDSYNPVSQTSELAVLAPVFEAEVLVLDELGASKPTDWVQDTMMQIINARYNEKRLTIFTTNYSDKRKKEEDPTKSLEERIGVALRSRLYEMCKTVEIEGEDYRKRSLAQTV
jgi:DNA replication protein DnaC